MSRYDSPDEDPTENVPDSTVANDDRVSENFNQSLNGIELD